MLRKKNSPRKPCSVSRIRFIIADSYIAGRTSVANSGSQLICGIVLLTEPLYCKKDNSMSKIAPICSLIVGALLLTSVITPAVSIGAEENPQQSTVSVKAASVAADQHAQKNQYQHTATQIAYEDANEYDSIEPAPASDGTVAQVQNLSPETATIPATQASYTFSSKVTGLTTDATLSLQQYDSYGSVWKSVKSVQVAGATGTTDTTWGYPYPVPTGSSTGYRFALVDNSTQVASYSAVTTVTVPAATQLPLKVLSAVTNSDKSVTFKVSVPSVGRNLVSFGQINTNGVVSALDSQYTQASGADTVLTFEAPGNANTYGTVSYRIAATSYTRGYTSSAPYTYGVDYGLKAITMTSSDFDLAKTSGVNAGTKQIIRGSLSTTASHFIDLQQYDNAKKVWVTKYSTGNDPDGTFSVIMPTAGKETSETWRLNISPTAAEAGIVTSATTVKRYYSTLKITQTAGKNKMVPWETNTFAFFVPLDNVQAQFQQKSGTTWKTIAKATVSSKNKYIVKFNITKGSTSSNNSTEQYRMLIPTTNALYKDSATGTITITKENPNKYTGLKKTIYNYAKPYCPTTFVTLDHKLGAQGRWGYTASGTQTITLYDKIPSQHLRTVSLHECGHNKQFALYTSSQKDWDDFVARMNPIYGGSGTLGMERNADCIANYWHKNSYYGYKGNCNGNRATVAKTIANGKRY